MTLWLDWSAASLSSERKSSLARRSSVAASAWPLANSERSSAFGKACMLESFTFSAISELDLAPVRAPSTAACNSSVRNPTSCMPACTDGHSDAGNAFPSRFVAWNTTGFTTLIGTPFPSETLPFPGAHSPDSCGAHSSAQKRTVSTSAPAAYKTRSSLERVHSVAQPLAPWRLAARNLSSLLRMSVHVCTAAPDQSSCDSATVQQSQLHALPAARVSSPRVQGHALPGGINHIPHL